MSLGVLFIVGCSSSTLPTIGDSMVMRGDESCLIRKKWNKEEEDILEGEGLIEKGKQMVKEGKNNIKKGEKLSREGKQLQERVNVNIGISIQSKSS